MKRPVWVVGLGVGFGLALMSGQIFAQTSNDALIASGTEFATGLLPSTIATTDTGAATSPVANAPGASNLSATSVVPNYTANSASLTPSTATGTNLMTMGVSEINRCANYKPTGDPVADQQCAGVNYLANRNPSGQYIVQSNDPMLMSQSLSLEAANETTSPGATCVPVTVTTPGTYETVKCSQTSIPIPVLCMKTAQVYCDRTSGCDQGGIVSNSWSGDMYTAWYPSGDGDYFLQFGTIGDNYWCSGAGVFDRTLTFTIKDASLVNKFVMDHAWFDDWLWVTVNGKDIYNSYIDVGHQTIQQTCTDEWGNSYDCSYSNFGVRNKDGVVIGPPERSTSWNLNAWGDGLPYLQEGTNTIFVRTIVSGCGESAIRIRTRQFCPCTVTWDDGCQMAQQATQGSGTAQPTGAK